MNSKSVNSSYADAQAYTRAWQRTAAMLDGERLRNLRQLSELEAAQRFDQLLCQPPPYPLRQSSGLVEQQRIFSRLRDRRR